MCIRSSMGGVWDVCVCLWVLWDVDDMRFLHTNSFYFVLLAVSSRFECCQAFYIANRILHYKICISLNDIIVEKAYITVYHMAIRMFELMLIWCLWLYLKLRYDLIQNFISFGMYMYHIIKWCKFTITVKTRSEKPNHKIWIASFG